MKIEEKTIGTGIDELTYLLIDGKPYYILEANEPEDDESNYTMKNGDVVSFQPAFFCSKCGEFYPVNGFDAITDREFKYLAYSIGSKDYCIDCVIEIGIEDFKNHL